MYCIYISIIVLAKFAPPSEKGFHTDVGTEVVCAAKKHQDEQDKTYKKT